ncbi:AraC family transcriptional regulator ligand-binding domain-containing protein [Promicromonospora sp. NPDC059942]|uniref:AraC family transcriptional regulator n=1 Tax=Promicromonospora sp. NPDC059942 TaxID=3347009 RepID=UPI00364D7AEF
MAGERFELEPTVQALLRDIGIAPPVVLRRARLPADLFARRPIELSADEYYRFWTALEVEGGDRSLAVDIGRAISVEMFSPPLFAALCSTDLTAAARRVATYKALMGPLRMSAETGQGLTISYTWPTSAASAPPPLLAVVELVFWVALARIATREPVRPSRVTVADRPANLPRLEEYLGARVRTSGTYSITFGTADASRPFLTENEAMWRVFAPDLRRRLSDLDASATVTDRVRAALRDTLPAGDASIGAVTSRLATSPRTLQRQLRKEGTTFQGVLTATREELARHYLDVEGLRTTEVAYLLGYGDTTSFYRAFRAWTGVTPQSARRGTPEKALLGTPPP